MVGWPDSESDESNQANRAATNIQQEEVKYIIQIQYNINTCGTVLILYLENNLNYY